MPITANCPGCGKTIAAPDGAAGRKARCPHCGAVVDIPASGTSVQALAVALGRSGQGKVGEAGAAEGTNLATAVATPPAEPALTPPSPGLRATTPRASGSLSSSRTSATTVDRMLARSSPYKSLRLMAAIVFGVGATLAVLIAVGGLVGLILVSLSGSPLIGVGVFLGAGLVGAGIFLGAKVMNEVLGLWADLGDRMRQTSQLLEDLLARRDNGI
jgi:hypothetical protein